MPTYSECVGYLYLNTILWLYFNHSWLQESCFPPPPPPPPHILITMNQTCFIIVFNNNLMYLTLFAFYVELSSSSISLSVANEQIIDIYSTISVDKADGIYHRKYGWRLFTSGFPICHLGIFDWENGREQQLAKWRLAIWWVIKSALTLFKETWGFWVHIDVMDIINNWSMIDETEVHMCAHLGEGRSWGASHTDPTKRMIYFELLSATLYHTYISTSTFAQIIIWG